ncbi:choline ABC transporter ATP-binding protein [Martelella soudanensis]|uniref:choline ABC transporter ATP-binding protein n=1 Tax=unclassified Martelella TaxID=2629616 RepID=UPI0015DE0461|nr:MULTISPECIES: choline ABC transporter ATP-binding protein [unclassified Martelella]
METVVEINTIDIIYGKHARRALPLVDAGHSRDDIHARTGNLVGVANASLTLGRGEIVVLMGLSGSGKSTLLRAVNGLAPVIRGEVRVHTDKGVVNPYTANAKALRALRARSVSMVFQQFALLPWLSVAENVGLGLELSGVPRRERRERIEEQLHLVNLSDWADHPIDALSGGMQQRVGLARAFATGAPILLMDEPFSALDPLIRAHLQDELLELQQRLRKSILFVSHDLDEAIKLGNRIAIMQAGKVIQTDTPRGIVKNPANDYVADFVANTNPLTVLTAEDIMKPVASRSQLDTRIAATVKSATPAMTLIRLLSDRPGTIGVVEGGRIAGTISHREIAAGLAPRRPERPTA